MTLPNANGDTNPQGDSGTGAGDNPLYAEYLERIPEDLRPTVTDVFKDWDAKTTQKFQERADQFQSLQSEYEPYKSVIEAWEPEAINEALSIAQMLQDNPQAVYEALQKAHNFGSGDGGQGTPTPTPAEILQQPVADPRLDQLMAQQEQMQAMFAQDQQAKAEAAAEAQLDKALADLKTAHGDFDENYVLGLIATGMDPNAAVGQFKQAVEKFSQQQLAPGQQAPNVVGSGGGGYPSQAVDVSKMTDAERKAHVIATIQAHNAAE